VGSGVGVGVGVDVGVGVGTLSVSTISCGSFADSLLARLSAVVCVVFNPKLTRPLPPTSEVTSRSYVTPAVTGPDEATAAGAIAGALVYVILASFQTISDTE
jgi:hypothetical protein